MDKNLIICTTPLQILLAEKIMDVVQGDYTVVIITRHNNDKYQYYSNRIKEKSNSLLYYYLRSITKYSRLWEVLNFKIDFDLFSQEGYRYCFLASIDNPLSLRILSNIKFQELRTFDDGTANI